MLSPPADTASDRIGIAAQAIASRRVPNATQRRERLGEIFPACEAPDTRPIESNDPDTTDREALARAERALRRALSIAQAENNTTLRRNLRWYQARLAHKSYEAIARADGKVEATVRTGVARARKFVLRIVHDLQHAQPAPLNGDAPAELEPLRKLWFQQDLDALGSELERTRSDYHDDPHWCNLAGLLAADRGRRSQAVGLYERALVHADASNVRARVLNNLGNLVDDHDCPNEARQYWLRARSLLPNAPAPLLNLLASASRARDYASAQHYVSELAALMNSGRLSAAERRYACQRLVENPRLAWLRETDAWAHGPARWIRRSRRATHTLRCAGLATLGALLLALAVLFTRPASAATLAGDPASDTVSSAPICEKKGDGGDSMGGPAPG